MAVVYRVISGFGASPRAWLSWVSLKGILLAQTGLTEIWVTRRQVSSVGSGTMQAGQGLVNDRLAAIGSADRRW
jgi:hypothetical protein